MTTAIILAGGFGTRLRTAISDVPKPMAPINGRPFLEFQMDYWINQGVNRFILSVGYLHDAIIAHFGTAYRGVPIEYAVEEKPLGTGGGLLLATQYLASNAAVLVLNGDTFFNVDLAKLKAFHCLKKSMWTFSLFRTEETARYMGMKIHHDGQILSLASENIQTSSLANGGVYLIQPQMLKKLSEFAAGDKISLESDILPCLLGKAIKLFGIEFSGLFIDIGLPEDYLRSAELLTCLKS